MEQRPPHRGGHQDRPPRPSAQERQKWSILREQSAELLAALAGRLPPEALERARTYHFAGEWPSLINGLAYQLLDHQIPVTAAEKEALRVLLNTFERPHPRYRYITNRDDVLASLIVAEGE